MRRLLLSIYLTRQLPFPTVWPPNGPGDRCVRVLLLDHYAGCADRTSQDSSSRWAWRWCVLAATRADGRRTTIWICGIRILSEGGWQQRLWLEGQHREWVVIYWEWIRWLAGGLLDECGCWLDGAAPALLILPIWLLFWCWIYVRRIYPTINPFAHTTMHTHTICKFVKTFVAQQNNNGCRRGWRGTRPVGGLLCVSIRTATRALVLYVLGLHMEVRNGAAEDEAEEEEDKRRGRWRRSSCEKCWVIIWKDNRWNKFSGLGYIQLLFRVYVCGWTGQGRTQLVQYNNKGRDIVD